MPANWSTFDMTQADSEANTLPSTDLLCFALLLSPGIPKHKIHAPSPQLTNMLSPVWWYFLYPLVLFVFVGTFWYFWFQTFFKNSFSRLDMSPKHRTPDAPPLPPRPSDKHPAPHRPVVKINLFCLQNSFT